MGFGALQMLIFAFFSTITLLIARKRSTLRKTYQGSLFRKAERTLKKCQNRNSLIFPINLKIFYKASFLRKIAQKTSNGKNLFFNEKLIQKSKYLITF